MSDKKTIHIEIKDPPKSWWAGDPRVEPFMTDVNEAIQRSGLKGKAKTDVYNRAYEAVYKAIIKYAEESSQ